MLARWPTQKARTHREENVPTQFESSSNGYNRRHVIIAHVITAVKESPLKLVCAFYNASQDITTMDYLKQFYSFYVKLIQSNQIIFIGLRSSTDYYNRPGGGVGIWEGS